MHRPRILLAALAIMFAAAPANAAVPSWGGTITSNQSVQMQTQGLGVAHVSVSGTWTGTLNVQALEPDGVTWANVNAYVPDTGASAASITANGQWTVPVNGYLEIRVLGNTVSSGTASVWLNASGVSPVVMSNSAQLAGASIATGAGASNSGTQRVILSSDSPIGSVATPTDRTASGNITTTAGSNVALASLPGTGSATLQITGVWTGTLNLQGASDAVPTWTAIPAIPVGGSVPVTSITANGFWVIPVAGFGQIRLNGPTSSGTAVVSIEASAGAQATQLVSALPPGSNVIGGVNSAQVGGTNVVTAGVAGLQAVGGAAAAGSAVTGNPVLAGGSDGTNARTLAVDTSGRQVMVGAAAAGSAASGSPVLTGGTDGTNARARLLDSGGRAVTVGAAAAGSAVTGSPVLVAGSDGTNARSISTDPTGRVQVSVSAPFSDLVTPGTSVGSLNASAVLAFSGVATIGVYVSGTWAGTISFQATIDGANWFAVSAYPPTTGIPVQTTTANGAWQIPCAGYIQERAIMTAYTSGSAVVTLEASTGANAVSLANAIPPGTNAIGSVSQGTAAALSGAWVAKVTDGTNTMPTMDAAARAGYHQITDGTRTNTLKAASTAASAADTSLVVAVSPNSPLPTGANTIGAVTQASGPWTSNVTQLGGTNVVTAGVNGLQAVGGAAAVGATASGNPVQSGGVYNTAPTTLTNGQAGSLQLDTSQNLLVNLKTAIPTGANTIGAVTPQASAAGGTSKAKLRDLGSTVTSVKGSAGTLYGALVVNSQGAAAFLQCFDAVPGSVTLGTTTPDLEFSVAANASATVPLPTMGVSFSTAISCASTTTEKGSTTSAAGVEVFAQFQ